MNLSGKVAIVTGAGSGIGAATAVLFASEGASVALVDVNETSLNDVAQKCKTDGKTPLTIVGDAANDVEAKNIITKIIDHFGKIDVLVNNAGIYKAALVADPDALQIFDSVINTNLRSVVLWTNLVAPHLKATKGNIVNLSSVASLCVLPENSAYCVAKAGVEHFTRCSALELAAFGVRVNSVHPGQVKTNMLATALKIANDDDEAWKASQKTADGRLSEPSEIADLIFFLASDKARNITGSAYVSDGGYLLREKLV